MKFKTTKKAIRENYKEIFSIPYCNAQRLLSYARPDAYSCGVYGWSCDYYIIGDVVISTGYDPIGKRLNPEFVGVYEEKARNITKELWRYETTKPLMDALLDEFINKIKQLIK